MEDVSPDHSSIRLVGEYEAFTAAELFDYWVRPDLLVQWWPREATVDPRAGGRYEFRWPDKNWILCGEYATFEPGRKLAFSWSWNFDAVPTPLQVEVLFEDAEPCTRMTISHGPFTEDEAAQTERQAIREGWIHFAMRLAGLREGEAT